MLRTMRGFSRALPVLLIGGLFLCAGVSSAQERRRVIVIQRFNPFFPYYAYPYPYPAYYMTANFGEVKIDTHAKDATVYIDGGYAAKIKEAKKFALRPGNH